jgi:hypothetical protein
MHKVIAVLLFSLALAGPVAGAAAKKPPCAANIAACPDEGCVGPDIDSNLNLRKNLREGDQATQGPATVMTLAEMKDLADPENFTAGGPRDELVALGEGTKVKVLAYLLAAKAELSGESCNCRLRTVDETDNHLVLVTKPTVDTFPVKGKTTAALKAVFDEREPESITAEFTPRIRLDTTHPHPNFTKAVMDPLINKTAKRALLVRVTGMLMFDSEHFIQFPLVRVNNWEIHPVLKMEFCTTGTNCKIGDDTGWESIDDLH